MRDPDSKLVVPTAEEVLTKPKTEEHGDAPQEPKGDFQVHLSDDFFGELNDIKLLRPKKMQVNAFVDEDLYDYAQAFGLSKFVDGAVNNAIESWREVLVEIVPYEDKRKADRRAGKPPATISGRIAAVRYSYLLMLAEHAKQIPGFKLSRFMAAAMSVYAKKLKKEDN